MMNALLLFSAALASPNIAAEGSRPASPATDGYQSSVQWNCELRNADGKTRKISGKFDPFVRNEVKVSGPNRPRDIQVKNHLKIDQTGYFTKDLETRVDYYKLFFVSRYESKLSDTNSTIKVLEFDFRADDGIGFVVLKSTNRKSETNFGETSFEDTKTVESIGFCQFSLDEVDVKMKKVEIK